VIRRRHVLLRCADSSLNHEWSNTASFASCIDACLDAVGVRPPYSSTPDCGSWPSYSYFYVGLLSVWENWTPLVPCYLYGETQTQRCNGSSPFHIVTDLINALPGNSSVNTIQHATIDEDVFSMSSAPSSGGATGLCNLILSNSSVNTLPRKWWHHQQ
jgi:hypothetical protein